MGEPAGLPDVCAGAGAVVQGWGWGPERSGGWFPGLGLSPGDQVWGVEVLGGTTAFTCASSHEAIINLEGAAVMNQILWVKANFKPRGVLWGLSLPLIIFVENSPTLLQGFLPITSESWFLSRGQIRITRGRFSLHRRQGPPLASERESPGESWGLVLVMEVFKPVACAFWSRTGDFKGNMQMWRSDCLRRNSELRG